MPAGRWFTRSAQLCVSMHSRGVIRRDVAPTAYSSNQPPQRGGRSAAGQRVTPTDLCLSAQRMGAQQAQQ